MMLSDSQIKKYEEIVMDAPGCSAFARLADHYCESGDIDKAISVGLQGVEANPDYSNGHLILGKCYLAKGDNESAQKSFEQALVIDRHHHGALKMLGETLAALGKTDEAMENLNRIKEKDPLNNEINDLIQNIEQGGKTESLAQKVEEAIDQSAMDDMIEEESAKSDIPADERTAQDKPAETAEEEKKPAEDSPEMDDAELLAESDAAIEDADTASIESITKENTDPETTDETPEPQVEKEEKEDVTPLNTGDESTEEIFLDKKMTIPVVQEEELIEEEDTVIHGDDVLEEVVMAVGDDIKDTQRLESYKRTDDIEEITITPQIITALESEFEKTEENLFEDAEIIELVPDAEHIEQPEESAGTPKSEKEAVQEPQNTDAATQVQPVVTEETEPPAEETIAEYLTEEPFVEERIETSSETEDKETAEETESSETETEEKETPAEDETPESDKTDNASSPVEPVIEIEAEEPAPERSEPVTVTEEAIVEPPAEQETVSEDTATEANPVADGVEEIIISPVDDSSSALSGQETDPANEKETVPEEAQTETEKEIEPLAAPETDAPDAPAAEEPEKEKKTAELKPETDGEEKADDIPVVEEPVPEDTAPAAEPDIVEEIINPESDGYDESAATTEESVVQEEVSIQPTVEETEVINIGQEDTDTAYEEPVSEENIPSSEDTVIEETGAENNEEQIITESETVDGDEPDLNESVLLNSSGPVFIDAKPENKEPVEETGPVVSSTPETEEAIGELDNINLGNDIMDPEELIINSGVSEGPEQSTEPVVTGDGGTAFYNIKGEDAAAAELNADELQVIDNAEVDTLPDLVSAEPAAPETPEEKTEDQDAPQKPSIEIPVSMASSTLAELFYKQGQKEQAVEVYRYLLQKDPENKKLAERLEEIEKSPAPEGAVNNGKRKKPSMTPPKRRKVKRRGRKKDDRPLAGIRIKKKK